ncbi:MAG TPA: protein translocase subunit SecD, partial [Gaiellaceae bacterium]
MTNRRPHLALIGLLTIALAAAALLAVPGSPLHRPARMGLDLQGGLEVVLQATPTKGHRLTTADLDRSVEIMRSRIDRLGIAEPEIRKQGRDQIVIELAGVHDPGRALDILGKTARLELYDLEASLLPGVSIAANGVPIASTSRHELLTRARSLPEDVIVVTCSARTATSCPDQAGGSAPPKGVAYYYLFEHRTGSPALTGSELELKGTRLDFDPVSGRPVVTMQFNGRGNEIFHEVTRAEAVRGSIRGFYQHFAIVLDNELRSYPSIDYKKYRDGIDPSGGGVEITGMAGVQEARELALVLQTGALPVDFKTIERTDVSATLGSDSLRQARNAALAGLIVVALFLLLVYRFLGVVAVIGLGIYAAFMYAAILLFGVTLTLPGFAGLVLTIGVAADANIVVFERIKEEARAGKSVRAAIAAGYAKGFHTIIDANVVTCITALVLFAVATAGVKGFALMLLIGTVISLITAVAATRAMLGLLAGFRWFENPAFMGAS